MYFLQHDSVIIHNTTQYMTEKYTCTHVHSCFELMQQENQQFLQISRSRSNETHWCIRMAIGKVSSQQWTDFGWAIQEMRNRSISNTCNNSFHHNRHVNFKIWSSQLQSRAHADINDVIVSCTLTASPSASRRRRSSFFCISLSMTSCPERPIVPVLAA